MNNNDNSLEAGKYINILTYKKNGDRVSTPVWFIYKDNKIYIRTSNQSGKVKRIKNNNNVLYALCNIRGKIKGEWHSGVAKIEPDINKIIFLKIPHVLEKGETVTRPTISLFSLLSKSLALIRPLVIAIP